MSDAYDAAVAEVEETIRRLAPTLPGLEGALVSEWHLVLCAVADDGRPTIRLLTADNALLSHTLGALRFAEIQVEDWIREPDDQDRP